MIKLTFKLFVVDYGTDYEFFYVLAITAQISIEFIYLIFLYLIYLFILFQRKRIFSECKNSFRV